MAVRNKVFSWFVNNLVKPNLEKMDVPGFVVAKIGGKSNLREVVLPERVLVEIENEFDDKFGDKGASLLYETGKDFGWRYAKASGFPRFEDSSKTKVKNFMKLFIQYIESVYASEIDYELDLENSTLEMEMNEYIVCRKNGKGYLLTLGTWAGFMEYIFSEEKIEASKTSCEGLGDDSCNVTFAQPGQIDNKYHSEISSNLEIQKNYPKMNEIRKPKYANNSMKDLLEKGFFEFKDEKIQFEGNRFFIVEASFVFLLDKKLQRIEAAQRTVFDCAYEVGESIGKEKELSFVSDYLPALGWGDVKPINGGDRVQISFFPWTKFNKNSDITLFRGFLSGLISGIRNEEIKFEDWEESKTSGLKLLLKS